MPRKKMKIATATATDPKIILKEPEYILEKSLFEIYIQDMIGRAVAISNNCIYISNMQYNINVYSNDSIIYNHEIITNHIFSITCMEISRNFILTASFDNTTKLIDIKTGKIFKTFTTETYCMKATFSSNEKEIFVKSTTKIYRFDIATNQCLNTYKDHSPNYIYSNNIFNIGYFFKNNISDNCLLDSQTLVVASIHEIKIWDLSTFKYINTMTFTETIVKIIPISDLYIVMLVSNNYGSYASNIKILNIYTGKILFILNCEISTKTILLNPNKDKILLISDTGIKIINITPHIPILLFTLCNNNLEEYRLYSNKTICKLIKAKNYCEFMSDLPNTVIATKEWHEWNSVINFFLDQPSIFTNYLKDSMFYYKLYLLQYFIFNENNFNFNFINSSLIEKIKKYK